MTVPHITQKHWNEAERILPVHVSHAALANKAIEIALAEANAEQEQPLITADEARKLGAGNAEFLDHDGEWKVCGKYCCYMEENRFIKSPSVHVYKYRAIKQPKSVEATCQIKNLDTGELKTMTREAAKLLQAETKDVCDWFYDNGVKGDGCIFGFDTQFTQNPYTYKLKANLVKLDGELMTRFAAIAEWEKNTREVWFKSHIGNWVPCIGTDNCFGWSAKDGEYQLRPKPLKQVSWKDVPTGVMVRYRGQLYPMYRSPVMGYPCVITTDGLICQDFLNSDFELAPASEQPWIAVQDGIDCQDLMRDLSSKGFTYVFCAMRFRITGIAEGHELK